MSDAGKREQSHFDDEIYIVNDIYIYRGTPDGTKKRREVSLRLRVGAAQKDVLKEKKRVLEGLEKVGYRTGKNALAAIAPEYIKARLAETVPAPKKRKVLSAHSFYETKLLMEKHFVPYAGQTRIEELGQAWFNDYCGKKNDLNLSNHRKVINHFLKWAVANKYLTRRPEISIPSFAVKDHRERVVLTDDEAKKVLQACVDHDNGKILLYVTMYLFMGMRNMEICKLRWDEVDLAKGALKINPMSNRKRKARAIPINAFVLTQLRKRAKTASSEYVFPSARKNGKKAFMDPKGGYRKAWLKVLTTAGLDRHITPHDLRATFETHMHTNKEFTDTQREKMAGAAIDVQKNIYVSMEVEHLRGLEESVQIKGISKILGGKSGGVTASKKAKKAISPMKKGRKPHE